MNITAVARTIRRCGDLPGDPDAIGMTCFSWAGLKTRPYELAGSDAALGIIGGLCLDMIS
jgi:hypothetical protein